MSQSPSPPSAAARAAVARLVEEHASRLYAMAQRFCGDETMAEDLVQETFLRALRGWDGFRGEAEATTWLYRIAANACQRLKRRPAGAPTRDVSLDIESSFRADRVPDPRDDGGGLDASLAREAVEDLEGAIAALPDDLRLPLVLKDIAGLPVAAVGEILDLKEAPLRRACTGLGSPSAAPPAAACRRAAYHRRRTSGRSASTCWRPNRRPWIVGRLFPPARRFCASGAGRCSRHWTW